MITEKDIIKKVDQCKDEALDFLQNALRTPSVTGDEYKMAELVTAKFKEAGFEPKWYAKEENRPNVVVDWKGSREGRRFVFNGHMDVFPPVKGNPGLYGPWSGKLVDGYIYGRGAVDMKSGLCASIMAMKFLKEMGYDPKGSVLSTCVVDEENGGYAGTRYLLEKGLISGDFGIDPEPTRCKMLTQHCGIIRARVTYKSESGHTSMPHTSITSLEKAVKAVARLQELSKEVMKRYNEEMGVWSLLSVTMFESGEAGNMYPSVSSFVIDRRMIPGESAKEENDRIRAALDELKAKNPLYDYEYDVEVEIDCLMVDDDAEIVNIGRDAWKEITGKENPIYKRGGGSDASAIVLGANVPMPNFGPGNDVEESTHENEKLWLEDYFTFIKVYMQMIVKALGQ